MRDDVSNPILITGATGFIGSAVAAKLVKDGRKVILLARAGARPRYRNLALKECTFLEYDKLTSIGAILGDIRPAAILHLAASMIEETTGESVADLVEANFDLGVLLLHEAAIRGCKCFVFAGSFWQLGGIEKPGPNCLYADLKRSFSALLEAYGNRNGFSTATLILHDVYGEGDKRGKILDILLNVARGAPSPSLTEGMQIIDVTHVDDVASAFEHAVDYLLDKATVFHAQWWVSGNRLTLRELAGHIEKILGRDLNFRWGEKPYSDKTIMEPLIGTKVPGWEPGIEIDAWLARELNSRNNRL